MNVRKAAFVIASLAILTICSQSNMNRRQNSTPGPCKIADGGAPLPPIPYGVASPYVV